MAEARRVALVIATYEYADDGLRRLTAPARDAEALAEVLRDPAIAGFEVTTLVNEPHHVVGRAVGDLFRDRRRDDLTLLYFSGHGLKDDEGRLFLAMSDTRRDNLVFTGLSADHLDQAMAGCASRRQVLILDCCYSGAFPAGRIAKSDEQVHALERFQGRGRTVLTASDATQYSFEGERVNGEAQPSVFTRHLVGGLRDGSADLDGDGDITIDELYDYVHERVVDEMPMQRPKKQTDVEGRLVVARNVNWTLPAYLTNAARSPIVGDRLGALDGLARLYRQGNDVVRVHVRAELRALAADDSRLVSTAASERLETLATSGVAPERREPTPATPNVTPTAAKRGRRVRPRTVQVGIPVAVGVLALIPFLLPNDPEPDTATVTAEVSVGCDATPPDGGPDFKRDLSVDLANEALPAVWHAQHKLFELGYLTENQQCDGKYGDQTEHAVRAFKPRNNLPPSDTIDAATWEKLFDDSAQRP